METTIARPFGWVSTYLGWLRVVVQQVSVAMIRCIARSADTRCALVGSVAPSAASHSASVPSVNPASLARSGGIGSCVRDGAADHARDGGREPGNGPAAQVQHIKDAYTFAVPPGCMLYELIPNVPEHRLLPLMQRFAEMLLGKFRARGMRGWVRGLVAIKYDRTVRHHAPWSRTAVSREVWHSGFRLTVALRSVLSKTRARWWNVLLLW